MHVDIFKDLRICSTHIHTSIYIYRSIQIYIYIYIYVRTCGYVALEIYIQEYTFMHIHIDMFKDLRICSTRNIYTGICIYV